jgi:hypothetical protein
LPPIFLRSFFLLSAVSFAGFRLHFALVLFAKLPGPMAKGCRFHQG